MLTIVLYIITFSARNNCPHAMRIRVIPPKKAIFSCNFVPITAVASGLDIRVEVECLIPPNTSLDNVFEDFLVVVMGEHRLHVPLVARKPLADIHFKTLLDLGIVVEDQLSTRNVAFENKGKVAAIVSIEKCDKFVVNPKSFELSASACRDVSVTLKSKEAGAIRELMQVLI
jgi:hypothetical protein